VATDAGSPEAALRALRRQRQRNRLGDLEWFDAAYRVYLVALFGGGGVLWASGVIGEQPVTGTALADVRAAGPAWLGVIAAVAVLLGLRNGAQGGPLALEEADVHHVLLSPVRRRTALARPAWQRIRGAVALSAIVGGVAGQLAGRRLPGSGTSWFASGLLAGAAVGGLWAGCALVAHGARLVRWAATAIGAGLLAWQLVAAWTATGSGVPGPFDTAGSLAMWGWRQRAVDVAPLVVAAALVAVGVTLLTRTSLEALARRASLVAQLRFAVTMQDVRTVVLLRRQLNQESARTRPWVRTRLDWVPRNVIRRGLHGLLRTPTTRVIRMLTMSALFGAALAVAAQENPSVAVVAAVLGMLLGLEASEALSQEVDHPDRTDALITDRDTVMSQHLWVAAIALVPCAVVAGGAAAAVLGGQHLAAIALLMVPVTWAAAAGAIVSTVRDLPDPTTSVEVFSPPEMAGFATAMRMLVPIVVSGLPVVAVVLVGAAGGTIGAAVRAAVFCMLMCAALRVWVRTRDRVRASVQQFLADGRQATAQQRSGA
jgi:hypothetical protein